MAVARYFAAEGAWVAPLTDLDLAELKRLAAELRGRGAEVVPVGADVRDGAAVERAVRTAVETLGGLDVLYNNAGVYWPARDAPVDRLDRAVWDEIDQHDRRLPQGERPDEHRRRTHTHLLGSHASPFGPGPQFPVERSEKAP